MRVDSDRFATSSRAIESVHSGVLLLAFAVILSLFMGVVMLVNGS